MTLKKYMNQLQKQIEVPLKNDFKNLTFKLQQLKM